MKKYIKPAMAIVELNNETILADSNFGNTNNTTGWSGNKGGFARDGRGDFEDDEEDF